MTEQDLSPAPPQPPDPARLHWIRNRRVTAVLLFIWFGVTFVVSFYARELNFRFFGWPFSFWVAAQGALLVYGLIIAFYAWYMNRLDRLMQDASTGRSDA